MAGLFERISKDLTTAQKEKNELVLSTLRMVKSAIGYAKIEKRKKEMDDEDVIAVLKSEVKKRKDSISAYEEGKRKDLADKEKAELAIIKKYLPQEASQEEIRAVVEAIIEETEADSMKDFGRVMATAMKKLEGRADGNAVKTIVREILA